MLNGVLYYRYSTASGSSGAVELAEGRAELALAKVGLARAKSAEADHKAAKLEASLLRSRLEKKEAEVQALTETNLELTRVKRQVKRTRGLSTPYILNVYINVCICMCMYVYV